MIFANSNGIFSLSLIQTIRMFVVFSLFLTIFSVLLSAPLLAQEKPDILILNSDSSIKKYLISQEVFQANQDKPSKTVNLAEHSTNEIKDIIEKSDFKIIYCIGAKAYLLAHHYAVDKKIIFSSVLNWRRLPVIEQSYGVSQELPLGMQLTMYHYLFPEIKKIGVLYSEQFNKEWLESAKQSAREVDIEVVGLDVNAINNLTVSIEKLLIEVDALWLISDPLVLADRRQIINIFQLAALRKKPVFTYSDIFVDLGAVLVISADNPTIGRQVSVIANNLRKNKTVVERLSHPAGSHIILNMKKLKEYSLKLNKEALSSVNQIIE